MACTSCGMDTGKDCRRGLETSSSSGNIETRDAKERSPGTLGNENVKASRRRDLPAGRRGANVLTSDMDQQHPDAP